MEKANQSNYILIHKWLNDNHGRAEKCENVACQGTSTKFNWALRHDKEHKKDVSHYIELCSRCHAQYDKSPTAKRAIKGKSLNVRIEEGLYQRFKMACYGEGSYLSKKVQDLILDYVSKSEGKNPMGSPYID